MSDIRETLAQEAIEAEAHQGDPPAGMHRTRAENRSSQVYTVRMPTDRLTELRAVADELGEQPSSLMRRWVLERLDAERDEQSELTDVHRSLTEALRRLERFSTKHTA